MYSIAANFSASHCSVIYMESVSLLTSFSLFLNRMAHGSSSQQYVWRYS